MLYQRLFSFILAVLFFVPQLTVAAQTPRRTTSDQLTKIRRYIKKNWRTLSRTHARLADAAFDPKFKRTEGAPSLVYVPATENLDRIKAKLRQEMKPKDFARIELRTLPASTEEVREPGLLYLPHPYVVPGGRFNEMYGWDSYFILVGLVRDGELALAKGMVENFLYQIEQYGKILNANRTYYLSRSQPPFLTQMVLAVYQKTKDKRWLAKTLPAIERYYRFWTSEPHLVPQTGLARYYDTGAGPAPEVVSDERDAAGRTHYDRAREFFKTHEVKDYDVARYYNRERDELTDLFYTGDRSMRESGFDPSNRFGALNIDIIHYNPVCLNSLLYMMEQDAADITRILGQKVDSQRWSRLARDRKEKINTLLWDETSGMYLDLNFETGKRRNYPFATTFFPLWAGIATPEQARRVVENLKLFEAPGGILTSTNQSGSQWDAPFGWAPLQLIGVWGLRRYGYHAAANRISVNFLSLVLKEFMAHGTIVEKYDVVKRGSQVSEGIKFGYSSNEIGFGWTNATFTELFSLLPKAQQHRILEIDQSSE